MKLSIVKLRMAGLGLLVLLTAVLSHGNVPLYDGVGFPDEAYRYVDKPDDAKTTPAVAGNTTFVLVSGGKSQAPAFLTTGEQGPQASVYIPRGAVTASGEGSQVKVSINPGPLFDVSPNDTPVGNSYRFSFVTAPAGSKYAGKGRATLALRLPQGVKPVNIAVAYREAGKDDFKQLPTQKIGADIYQSPLPALGDYQLVSYQQGINKQTAMSHPWVAAVLIAVFGGVLLAVIIVVRRMSKSGVGPNLKQ